MKVSTNSIENDVICIVTSLFCQAIDTGRVAMHISKRPGGGRIIDIKDQKAGTAEIVISMEDGDPTIYLNAGAVTPFEWWLTKSWQDNRPRIEEVIAVIGGIVDGKFDETLWKRNGEIVQGQGRVLITLPDGEHVLEERYKGSRYNPFRHPPKEDVKYLPWDVELCDVTLDAV